MKIVNDEMCKGCITIKTTSELSLEKLHNLKEEGISKIIVTNNKEKDTFSIDIFEKIKIKIAEYIQNIPQVMEDDPDKEKKILNVCFREEMMNLLS